jgi:hypothetical protein
LSSAPCSAADCSHELLSPSHNARSPTRPGLSAEVFRLQLRPGDQFDFRTRAAVCRFASFARRRHAVAQSVITFRAASERARPANRSHSVASVRHSSKDFASCFMWTASTQLVASLAYSRLRSIENNLSGGVNNVTGGVDRSCHDMRPPTWTVCQVCKAKPLAASHPSLAANGQAAPHTSRTPHCCGAAAT